MKKIMVFCILMVSLLITVPVSAQGLFQEPEPTAGPATIQDQDVLYFSQLGFTETRLIGPFDSTSLQASFPEEWRFTQPGTLNLEYTLSIYGADYVEGISQSGGVLNISVNDTDVASIPLNIIGSNSLDIPLAPEVLVSQRTDGRFDLNIELFSQESCTRDIDVDVVIKESSFLRLPHTSAAPVVDLTLFPRPFYQPDSLNERKILLVVPDNASNAELQAAMEVAAGLGNLTNGGLVVDLVVFSSLVPAMINSEHLVFVSKPASIPLIAELELPVKLVNGLFDYSETGAEDGLVQEIISPWNNTKAILIVSGNTDEGILKAGQAIKSGQILTTGLNNVSFVQDYQPRNQVSSLAEDQSLKSLGFNDRTISYAGTSSIYIDFFIPPQNMVGNDAFLNLHFSHSSILSFNTSGMTVLLNGRAINSVQFTEENSQLKEVQIKLPPSAFLQGSNQLQIQVRLVPLDNCSQIGFFNGTWATIFSDSSLHLPTQLAARNQIQNINLADYPEVIMSGLSMGNLMLIVNKGDETSLETASSISFDLGENTGVYLNQIKIMDAGTIDTEELSEDNIMIIGRPGDIPLVYDLKDQLPAPFETGSEVPINTAAQVVYRVVPGSDVGYLEIFASPWNAERLAMLVSANSDEGLALAGSALTGGDFQGSLTGDFAIISSGRIIGLNTSFPVDSELLDTQNQIGNTEESQPDKVQIPLAERNWMIPAIGFVTLLTLIVVVMVLIPILRKPKG